MGMVSIREAATRLGISEDTVRRHLRNGELSGEQEKTPQGFRWRVQVNANGRQATNGTTNSTNGHQDATAELIATLRGQVEAQAKELTELREDRRREVSELHVLLQTAQTALVAPKESIKTGWWEFWK